MINLATPISTVLSHKLISQLLNLNFGKHVVGLISNKWINYCKGRINPGTGNIAFNLSIEEEVLHNKDHTPHRL